MNGLWTRRFNPTWKLQVAGSVRADVVVNEQQESQLQTSKGMFSALTLGAGADVARVTGRPWLHLPGELACARSYVQHALALSFAKPRGLHCVLQHLIGVARAHCLIRAGLQAKALGSSAMQHGAPGVVPGDNNYAATRRAIAWSRRGAKPASQLPPRLRPGKGVTPPTPITCNTTSFSPSPHPQTWHASVRVGREGIAASASMLRTKLLDSVVAPGDFWWPLFGGQAMAKRLPAAWLWVVTTAMLPLPSSHAPCSSIRSIRSSSSRHARPAQVTAAMGATCVQHQRHHRHRHRRRVWRVSSALRACGVSSA